MPQMTFHVRWPDGSAQQCYSPSTVVGEHLEPGVAYGLEDFVARSRTALQRGSDRVAARYGSPCSAAAATFAAIEARAGAFGAGERVLVERFGT